MSATQTKDNWTGSGYDAEPPKGDGLYLRLKEKGETVRLRLISDPYRFVDVLKTDFEQKILNKAAWIAIHKFVENGKPQKKVVVFQAGPMVYGLIKDLTERKDWGDPKLYDVEVTRTEQAGKYYTVAPLPKPMGPISADEEKLVKEANIDLAKACAPKDAPIPSPAMVVAPERSANYDPFADE